MMFMQAWTWLLSSDLWAARTSRSETSSAVVPVNSHTCVMRLLCSDVSHSTLAALISPSVLTLQQQAGRSIAQE